MSRPCVVFKLDIDSCWFQNRGVDVKKGSVRVVVSSVLLLDAKSTYLPPEVILTIPENHNWKELVLFKLEYYRSLTVLQSLHSALSISYNKIDIYNTVDAICTATETLSTLLETVRFCVESKDIERCKNLVSFLRDGRKDCLACKAPTKIPGRKEIEELDFEMAEFLSSVSSARDTVESIKKRYRNKVRLLKVLLMNGLEYVGSDRQLDDILTRNGVNYIVLFVKQSFSSRDVLKSINELLEMTRQNRRNHKYLLVDLDVSQQHGKALTLPNKPLAYHYKDAWLSYDAMSQLHNSKAGQVWLQPQRYVRPPAKLSHLEIICPGSCRGECARTKLLWGCCTCKKYVEYDLHGALYCACGASDVLTAKFHCPDLAHLEPLSFTHRADLDAQLDALEPLPETSLLLIGQSGVGKSTWINAIANYMSFATLEEAAKNDLLWLIPTEFSLCDENTTIVQVKVGDDKNENVTVGASATQGCRTYTLVTRDKLIRLTDTPGLGDTRGYEQDLQNVALIIRYMAQLESVHAICFLLKPNENRRNVSFTYCIKELFCHLHRVQFHNIVFCFTNSRNTSYKPGTSLTLLRQVLTSAECNNVRLDFSTMYCFDSESYRFLCALKQTSIQFSDMDKKVYGDSWVTSVKETKRLLNYVDTIRKHHVRGTLNVCALRHRMSLVTKSLRMASKMTESAETVRYNAEIKALSEQISTLSADVTSKTKVKNYVSPLFVRVVCRGQNCVETYGSDVYYKTTCCLNCDASKKFDIIPNPELLSCTKLTTSSCTSCSCSWRDHIVINYTQKTKSYYEHSENTKQQIKEVNHKILKVQRLVAQETNKALTGDVEKKKLLDYGTHLSEMLKDSAMMMYNDDRKNYLAYLVVEEESRPDKTQQDRARIKELIEIKTRCEDEDKIVEAMKVTLKDPAGKMIKKSLKDWDAEMEVLSCFETAPSPYNLPTVIIDKVIWQKVTDNDL